MNTMTITTLEALFAGICEQHDLNSISIEFRSDGSKGYEWYSCAYWSGAYACALGATPTDALSGAIADANARREVKPAVHDVSIAVEELAP